ncbi:membrane-associated protein, putative [Bodo saltans]|uniref:Membrane-associated protein, putative n=1 Tax=Bodo saltans TaxID=75058 RepID=A0A0S4JED3_BODSA|nr:membrane-associated protein, putative [Bodo saltans]|eukprot:CUG88395.1 membrane-associated protein, putative [Bodo saltans]
MYFNVRNRSALLVLQLLCCCCCIVSISAVAVSAALSSSLTSSSSSSSSQYGMPSLVSPASESSYYHGTPAIIEIPSSSPGTANGSTHHLVAAYEVSRFPASNGGELWQSIGIAQSLDGGASWSSLTRLVPQNTPAEPFWAPALHFDNVTDTLFVYFSQSVFGALSRGGAVFVAQSSDRGVSFSAPQPVIGVSGVIARGAIITIDASQNVQGLPTWAFALESARYAEDGSVTIVGTTVVRAQVNSTIYEISTVLLSSNFTNPILVSLSPAATKVGKEELAASGSSAVVAALIASDNRTSNEDGDNLLVVYTTSDATLVSGWTVSPSVAIVTSSSRGFAAAATTPTSLTDDIHVAVATFRSSNSTEIAYESMEWATRDQQLSVPTVTLNINASSVNSSDYVKPTNVNKLIPSDIFLAAMTSTSSSSTSSFITAFIYDGQVFATRVGLVLAPVAVAAKEPSSSTAIAITFIIIVAVSTALAIVFIVGHLREKKKSSEEAKLMKPEHEDDYEENYGGSM